jgi:general secretion pathway protein H
MPTSAAGSDRAAACRLRTPVGAQRPRQTRLPGPSRGLTLLEMLVVLTIVTVATAGVAWAVRDTDHDRLEQQAVRLQAQLEVARALARATASVVRLRWLPDGYAFEGLPDNDTALQRPQRWMDAHITARETNAVVLGPEPMGAPWRIELSLGAARLALASDGWSPVTIE